MPLRQNANANSQASLSDGFIAGGIERRAAIGAEGLLAPPPTFRGLDVDPGLPLQEAELAFWTRHHDTEGGAGKLLAIGAMAYANPFRVDFRLEPDCPAVT